MALVNKYSIGCNCCDRGCPCSPTVGVDTITLTVPAPTLAAEYSCTDISFSGSFVLDPCDTQANETNGNICVFSDLNGCEGLYFVGGSTETCNGTDNINSVQHRRRMVVFGPRYTGESSTKIEILSTLSLTDKCLPSGDCTWLNGWSVNSDDHTMTPSFPAGGGDPCIEATYSIELDSQVDITVGRASYPERFWDGFYWRWRYIPAEYYVIGHWSAGDVFSITGS